MIPAIRSRFSDFQSGCAPFFKRRPQYKIQSSFSITLINSNVICPSYTQSYRYVNIYHIALVNTRMNAWSPFIYRPILQGKQTLGHLSKYNFHSFRLLYPCIVYVFIYSLYFKVYNVDYNH